MGHRYELSDQQWKRLAPLLPQPRHHGGRGRPSKDHRRIVNGILWRLHTGAPGATSRNATVPGKASIPVSGVGDAMAPGLRSSRSCWKSGNTMVAWATLCGLSMPPSFAPAVPRAGRKKNPDAAPRLGGPKPAQLKSLLNMRSDTRGGFGTKVNLLVTDRGVVLGIYVTPGQQHESTAFEPLMRRILLPRRRGIPYWPAKLAGDKGYSYPHIRAGSGGITSNL